MLQGVVIWLMKRLEAARAPTRNAHNLICTRRTILPRTIVYAGPVRREHRSCLGPRRVNAQGGTEMRQIPIHSESPSSAAGASYKNIWQEDYRRFTDGGLSGSSGRKGPQSYRLPIHRNGTSQIRKSQSSARCRAGDPSSWRLTVQ